MNLSRKKIKKLLKGRWQTRRIYRKRKRRLIQNRRTINGKRKTNLRTKTLNVRRIIQRGGAVEFAYNTIEGRSNTADTFSRRATWHTEMLMVMELFDDAVNFKAPNRDWGDIRDDVNNFFDFFFRHLRGAVPVAATAGYKSAILDRSQDNRQPNFIDSFQNMLNKYNEVMKLYNRIIDGQTSYMKKLIADADNKPVVDSAALHGATAVLPIGSIKMLAPEPAGSSVEQQTPEEYKKVAQRNDKISSIVSSFGKDISEIFQELLDADTKNSSLEVYIGINNKIKLLTHDIDIRLLWSLVVFLGTNPVPSEVPAADKNINELFNGSSSNVKNNVSNLKKYNKMIQYIYSLRIAHFGQQQERFFPPIGAYNLKFYLDNQYFIKNFYTILPLFLDIKKLKESIKTMRIAKYKYLGEDPISAAAAAAARASLKNLYEMTDYNISQTVLGHEQSRGDGTQRVNPDVTRIFSDAANHPTVVSPTDKQQFKDDFMGEMHRFVQKVNAGIQAAFSSFVDFSILYKKQKKLFNERGYSSDGDRKNPRFFPNTSLRSSRENTQKNIDSFLSKLSPRGWVVNVDDTKILTKYYYYVYRSLTTENGNMGNAPAPNGPLKKYFQLISNNSDVVKNITTSTRTLNDTKTSYKKKFGETTDAARKGDLTPNQQQIENLLKQINERGAETTMLRKEIAGLKRDFGALNDGITVRYNKNKFEIVSPPGDVEHSFQEYVDWLNTTEFATLRDDLSELTKSLSANSEADSLEHGEGGRQPQNVTGVVSSGKSSAELRQRTISLIDRLKTAYPESTSADTEGQDSERESDAEDSDSEDEERGAVTAPLGQQQQQPPPSYDALRSQLNKVPAARL